MCIRVDMYVGLHVGLCAHARACVHELIIRIRVALLCDVHSSNETMQSCVHRDSRKASACIPVKIIL